MEFPLTLGLQKTGLPLIVTSGKLKNLCFLVDTGATHNVLFTYVFEHFKNEFKVLEEHQSTMGIEGNYKECPTIEATFTFEGIDYTSTFTVLDATNAVAQIQEETVVKNKWILDFDKLTIKTTE